MNGHGAVWVAVAMLALAIAGVTWAGGEKTEKLNSHAERIEKLEEAQKKIHEIDRKQAVLMNRVENMAREQRAYQDRTTKTLEKISKQLD